MNSAHSKDELCSFKTVGVVTSGRSKMAVILYIYRLISKVVGSLFNYMILLSHNFLLLLGLRNIVVPLSV